MSELIRLQKYIAMCGVSSRRAAEEYIKDGRVRVGDKVIAQLGTKVDPDYDTVYLDGKKLVPEKKLYYIMLNKPPGYVTTAKDQFGRNTVLDLTRDISARLYPIGRLDYDTDGLLLLTNDGDFAQKLMHPSHSIDKTYRAVVKGNVTQAESRLLQRGIVIDGKKTAPAKVQLFCGENNTTILNITIHEGRNRQVRKMCSAIGHDVLKLTRISVGDIVLGNLPLGKWRHLNPVEINKLKK